MVSLSTISTRRLALLIIAVVLTTLCVGAFIAGLIHHTHEIPTMMITNGLDIGTAGIWIVWAVSRLGARVDQVEHEIRTDVVYAARGTRLHKIE